MAVLQPRFVAAEHQTLSRTGPEVGLQAGHEGVILVADRGVRVVEDRASFTARRVRSMSWSRSMERHSCWFYNNCYRRVWCSRAATSNISKWLVMLVLRVSSARAGVGA
jgi:hypothetical protein